MNYVESIIEELNNGEDPQVCLKSLETLLEDLTGKLPDNRDELSKWVNSTCSLFYQLRYVFVARYYPGGPERLDLLHKAAGLLPSCAQDAPKTHEKIIPLDLEA